ncbi:uncharacterized protein K460DRAFT_125108 [Cucurbitaria berberidis CBS 394.84]|uniref:Uncharacterized protein n=1 Tax=Cucurbitaria berberidis CBS 394.84 TaxID=1168544 RepID=A0A9P4GJS7_9PLEO|nr:uncharacterized protein K460DRAFT_125108 [Cucurbitaria berberidis CBS 394.84]KAF1846504.1 hypothetical protein K460DRAFT_125108 [Cucurbitaria berberidis CBS 394.84]
MSGLPSATDPYQNDAWTSYLSTVARQNEQMVDYTNATYERLPRELRDLVYQSLWLDDHPPIASHEAATNYFGDEWRFITDLSKIANKDFWKEAVEWYYEHGCVGRRVKLPDLETFLCTDHFSVEMTPATGTMRSLSVSIAYPEGYEWTLASAIAIRSQLTPLWQLDLMNGFTLTIHIHASFDKKLNVHDLAVLCVLFKNEMLDFARKNCNVMFQFEFEQVPPYRSLSMETPRPLMYHLLEGQAAKDMLTATSEQWLAYLSRYRSREHRFTVVY